MLRKELATREAPPTFPKCSVCDEWGADVINGKVLCEVCVVKHRVCDDCEVPHLEQPQPLRLYLGRYGEEELYLCQSCTAKRRTAEAEEEKGWQATRAAELAEAAKAAAEQARVLAIAAAAAAKAEATRERARLLHALSMDINPASRKGSRTIAKLSAALLRESDQGVLALADCFPLAQYPQQARYRHSDTHRTDNAEGLPPLSNLPRAARLQVVQQRSSLSVSGDPQPSPVRSS